MFSVCPESGSFTYLYRHVPVRQDLLRQMSLIRERATESEAIVRNVTRDIKVLDLAKNNLTLSMTTLKRLQMLGWFLCFRLELKVTRFMTTIVNALSQLEDYVKDKKYPDITQSLSVSRWQCTLFT
jgi:vacuolar protein sorting-associated protein 53